MIQPSEVTPAENQVASPAVNADPQRMQCMEVWGGNRSTSSAFEMPGLRVYVYSRPHEDAALGGDVYYLSSCASGRISRILLADVCGHGEAVAKTATLLRRMMRRNINYISQNRLTNELNQEFTNLLEGGGFATALISSYFSPTSTVTLCNAGHPQPFIYRAATDRWSVHEPTSRAATGLTNLPLGFDESTSYKEFSTRLALGDLLFCYSDALSEAATDDGMLGVAGLLDLVSSVDADDPSGLTSGVLDAVTAVSPRALEQDDVTIMLIECTGSPVRLWDNIAAPFRLIKSFFSRQA